MNGTMPTLLRGRCAGIVNRSAGSAQEDVAMSDRRLEPMARRQVAPRGKTLGPAAPAAERGKPLALEAARLNIMRPFARQ
jgi:hypothetical protein